MSVISKVKSLFFKQESKKIFGHKADGEPCCVCEKPMHTKQGITMVGSGEKMHSECWSRFFDETMEDMIRNSRK